MNVVSYEFGQALQLVPLEEMRPVSGVYVPDLLRAVRERYRFLISPDISQPLKPEDIKFENGVLAAYERQIAIKSVGIYPDGILTVCWNTDDANIVTDDLLNWSISVFGLRQPRTIIARKLASHVVVDFDVPIDSLLAGWSPIVSAYKKILDEDQGVSADIHVQRLAFGSDPIIPGNQFQNIFVLEQKSGVPVSSKRYFSAAPLSTASHLSFLSAIEQMTIKMAEQ